MRDWLNKYEIIFKTVVYLFVSILTIILTILSIRIADNQVQIMQEQSKIMRYQQVPSLYAKVDLILDPKTNRYMEDTLSIYNDGGPLHYFSVYPAIFFKMEYGKKDTELQKTLIPIVDYYSSTFYTGNRIDKIVFLSGGQNNVTRIKCQNDLREYANSNDCYGFLELARYIEIKYFDKFNEEHSEYHYVDPIVGSGMIENPPVTKNAVIQLVKLHHEALENRINISLSEATPELLISKFNKATDLYKNYPLLKFLDWQRIYK